MLEAEEEVSKLKASSSCRTLSLTLAPTLALTLAPTLALTLALALTLTLTLTLILTLTRSASSRTSRFAPTLFRGGQS